MLSNTFLSLLPLPFASNILKWGDLAALIKEDIESTESEQNLLMPYANTSLVTDNALIFFVQKIRYTYRGWDPVKPV